MKKEKVDIRTSSNYGVSRVHLYGGQLDQLHPLQTWTGRTTRMRRTESIWPWLSGWRCAWHCSGRQHFVGLDDHNQCISMCFLADIPDFSFKIRGSSCPELRKLLPESEDVAHAGEHIDLADVLIQAEHSAIVGEKPWEREGRIKLDRVRVVHEDGPHILVPSLPQAFGRVCGGTPGGCNSETRTSGRGSL